MALYVNCDLSGDGWIGQYAYGRRVFVVNNFNKNFVVNQRIYCSIRYMSTTQFGAISISPTKQDMLRRWQTLGLFLINSRSRHGYRILIDPNDKMGCRRYEIFHNFSHKGIKLCSKIGLYKVGVCIVTEPDYAIPREYWKLSKKGWIFLGNSLPNQYRNFVLKY